jgi:WD40 repeat protein
MPAAINGHDISPFDKGLVACACEDGTVGLFSVPLEGLKAGEQLSTPATLLEGHEKRVLAVAWHPRVAGVLASHDGSKTVKVRFSSLCVLWRC